MIKDSEINNFIKMIKRLNRRKDMETKGSKGSPGSVKCICHIPSSTVAKKTKKANSEIF